MNSELQTKLDKLKAYIRQLGSLAVGFSGGVDSTFLISVAHEVLGDRALAVTETDPAVPGREVKEAKEFCESRGIRHVTFSVDPLTEEGYRKNSADRCYYCKRLIFTQIRKIAKENNIDYVAEGSNMDDLGDYRPGLRAAAELGITEAVYYPTLKAILDEYGDKPEELFDALKRNVHELVPKH
ncbi:MAG: hypothetical protein J6W36_02360, partial [Clostridiales bacterium]|nr:hypothetical protein [Clostridiales bacterium]